MAQVNTENFGFSGHGLYSFQGVVYFLRAE
jgi:hypothetical protein